MSRVIEKGKGKYTGERDQCVFYRYYYYCSLKKIRLETALEILEREFFISSSTLMNRMTMNSDQLRIVLTENRTTKDLKKMYPHLNWN